MGPNLEMAQYNDTGPSLDDSIRISSYIDAERKKRLKSAFLLCHGRPDQTAADDSTNLGNRSYYPDNIENNFGHLQQWDQQSQYLAYGLGLPHELARLQIQYYAPVPQQQHHHHPWPPHLFPAQPSDTTAGAHSYNHSLPWTNFTNAQSMLPLSMGFVDGPLGICEADRTCVLATNNQHEPGPFLPINCPIDPTRHELSRGAVEIPICLPFLLAHPANDWRLSRLQRLLRCQIEAFEANNKDASTHIRGRNTPIQVGQVGIRCVHCAHLPANIRNIGSMYFPKSVLGLYQAGQNMNRSHMQSGECRYMPQAIKEQFAQLVQFKQVTKLASGVGRTYWANSAIQLGLVDTDDGIFFARYLPVEKNRGEEASTVYK